MKDINIREALEADLPRLRELEQKLVDSERPYDAFLKDDGVTYYDLENLISDPNSYLLVVESEREVIGSGYAQIRNSRLCHVHDLSLIHI